MKARQLHIVGTHTAHSAHAPAQTAAQRVFGHWVFMLGKNPARCAMGPTRRKVIDAALGLYDEDTLLLAIEGCAASAWHAGENDRGRAFNDIELILRNEAHIERFAAEGEALREAAAQAQRAPQAAPAEATDPAEVARVREQLRQFAASRSGRRL